MWLLLLPLGLFEQVNGDALLALPVVEIVSIFFLALLLLSVDEVANQLVRRGRRRRAGLCGGTLPLAFVAQCVRWR